MNDFVGCSDFYNCENIQDSRYIVNSKNVDNSNFIHYSTDVSSSTDVFIGEDITNSSQVFYGQFVSDSVKIFGSSNVISSENVVNSQAIYNSRNIYDCTNILRGTELRNCADSTDSFFCADSSKLKHCLFCNNLHEKEYHVFNQPIDEDRFNVIMRQYTLYSKELLTYMKTGWPSSMLIPTVPVPHNYFHKHYQNLNEKFWRWVCSLPGYNAQLLYEMTLKSEVLLKS